MNFQAIYDAADKAGRLAAEACRPVPMIVGHPSSLFGSDVDLSKQHWYVTDGVCGFAWIKFKGNIPFGRWAKSQKLARASYPSGLHISVSGYNQSMQFKEAYAVAFAEELREHGIAAWAESRMD